MANKKKSQEEKDLIAVSNRNHHFTFWVEPYNEKQLQFASLFMQSEKLIQDLEETARKAKHLENIRRENAFYMGVSLSDSDDKYSMEYVIKGVPALVEKIKKTMKELGL